MADSPLPTVAAAAAMPDDTDVLVVGLAEALGSPVLIGLPDQADTDWDFHDSGALLRAALSLGATTTVGSTAILAGSPLLVVVGLGDVDVTPDRVRRAAGAAARAATALAKEKELSVSFSFEAAEPEVIQGLTEGALLGAHRYHKATQDDPEPGLGPITVVTGAAEATQAVTAGGVIAAAVCQARDWVNTPPNLLYPESFAEEVRALAKAHRLEVEVLDERALAKAGYGGLTAVGSGSARPPRLVCVSYAPRGAKAHLALVGKGITFDSGGLDIKPADGMLTMKCDMSGAAAVVAAVAAISELKLKVKVTVWAALAENMPSGSAYRPSDVLTMYGGRTVENANTDAEGRLVMADALARAHEDHPDLLVDVATLTGACMVALGERTAGLMASDDATADLLLDAAESSGESVWHLPIPAEISENLTSDVADLASTGSSRYGGALTAAAFLREFTGEDQPWAHLDIAGPAWNRKTPYDHVPKGGTGAAVRTVVALARSLTEQS
ncbi:MAG: leucyl aminopeptidase [Propioniciclava sp.]